MKIGILGGGQLARMLALAGHPLGLEFIVLCPSTEACAAPVTEHLLAGFDDKDALQQFADQADVITYEFENVPAESVEFLSKNNKVFPPPLALSTGRDRLKEKTLFNTLGIKTANFADITDQASLLNAIDTIGLPAILKTRTEGYDGKGQFVLRDKNDAETAWQSLNGLPAILEGFVNFEREVSIIAVRSSTGEMVFYPLSENVHHEGILRLSTSLTNDPMQSKAEAYATQLLEKLDYVGVLAIEFFQKNGELLVNEYAPRVHNSGHWTIEGAHTSQFENHLRAIAGLPLGSTALNSNAAMVNLIGEIPDSVEILKLPNVHLHLYGKAPREGRKVGHITLLNNNKDTLMKYVEQLS